MTESMLTALMKLFAILASINKDVAINLSRNFVYSYLKTQFNQKIVDQSLVLFDKEINKLTMLEGMKESKRTSSLSVKVLAICTEINQGLHIRGKYLIVISLIQFSKYFEEFSDSSEGFRQTISDMVKTISEDLRINEDEYNNCRIFITEKFYKLPQKEMLLVVSNFNTSSFTKINYIHKDNLDGQFFFLKIHQSDLILFYYIGIEKIELGSKHVFPAHIYILPKGSALKSEKITPIYYSDIEAGFLRTKTFAKISLLAENIEFKFPKSKNGIQKFSFSAESGDLIGIVGGSGTGKSTLLKVLNGSYRLKNGNILINGNNLHSETKGLKGIIGYVPQDDLLIEELTVYQNLFYNARLCLGDLNDEEINDAVVKYLNNLDLFYTKDLRVGSPLNKFISGGQRKRLNIALELIKEPIILLADEPTTGLSSTDSENVMQLLKGLSLQGKIVIINIHQPSSEIFKMLDKLLILDKGGYPVYLGNPLDSFSYLKDIANRIDAAEIECPYCGNVQPDEMLKVIEAKQVNEFGEYTNERIITPASWYEKFQKNLQNDRGFSGDISEIPASRFKTPGHFKQFMTFGKRNFFSKLADKQYALFAIFISPILALILGFFTKYVSGNDSDAFHYLFIDNVNLPAYIFMSVIVALFIGLIVSAEEIIKDSKILEREKFLDLSRTAYFNSKITFLFILSALQMLIFVLLGNFILEIKDMTLNYWLVLFSTACFAVMLGLNISSALKSVIAIYITIPFLLVPLILLSGVIVKYDKMHYSISSDKYVPFVGDMMASRWAYEALLVNQFKNNEYQN
jgi:ABC-type multidrug transport system ATPase subunit